ncbi:MAG: hypothetical protein JSR68_08300 [Proteobacteria bacterium]|nr:hypothetical protein [Pseudomonadota bacterium]
MSAVAINTRRPPATSDDLRAWQARLGLDPAAAATLLGISRATYFNLLARATIDRRTELAAAAVEAGLKGLRRAASAAK